MPKESSTPDPAERARLSIDAFNRRDFDEVMRFVASDAVFDMSAVGMGTLEGVAAIRGFYEDWIGSYEEYRAEIDEFADVGNGITLAVLNLKGRPLGTSGEVRLRYATVGTTVENLTVHMTNYMDIDEARATAERLAEERGSAMSEQPTTPDLVDLSHRQFEAANRHDADAVLSNYLHDAVWDLSDAGMGVFEGVAAIRKFFEDWWGTWGDHSIEVEEVIDLGNGVMFSCVREDSRLPNSDGHVEQRRGWITLWARDKIERVTIYLDTDGARATAERLAQERADG